MGLNDEKVDEFVDVANKAVERLARHGVVSAGADLGSEAVVEDKLTSRLGSYGNGKCHPRKLECPANNIEVSGEENKGNRGSVGNSRGACSRS